MNNQLFSYDDLGETAYYDCVLKVPIGDYKIGAEIPCVAVDWANGIVQIDTETFKVEL